MPDCEWLIRIVPFSRCASSDNAGTVGFGVGNASTQSGTICFHNSPCASIGNCSPANTFGYSEPNRKTDHASSCETNETGGRSSLVPLPSRTRLIAEGFVADGPGPAY